MDFKPGTIEELKNQPLRNRAAELAVLLEHAPTAVFIVHDPECRHITANRAGESLFRVPRGAELSATAPPAINNWGHMKFFRNGSPMKIEELPTRVAAAGKPVVNLECSLVFDDGVVRELLAQGTPLRDEAGNLCGAVVFVVDMTQRNQINKLLQERESQLHAFVDQGPAIMAMFDRNMICLAASQRWTEKFGGGRKSIVGMNHYEIHPNLPEHWVESHQQGLAGETVSRDEDLWIQPDGQHFWFRWSLCPWIDSNNEVGGIIIMSEDITAQKLSANALQESEQRLEMAMVATELGLWDQDLARGTLAVSDSWMTIVGYNTTDPRPDRATFRSWVHPDDIPVIDKDRADYLSGRVPTYRTVFRLRTKKGNWIWIETYGKVVARDETGAATRIIGTIRDITHRHQTHEQLEEYRRNLRSLANEVMGVEERERRRLALDLHDGIGQLLNLSRMKLGLMLQLNDNSSQPQRECAEVKELLDRAAEQAGSMIFELSPPVLYELGLVPACNWLAEELHNRYQLRVKIVENEKVGPVPEHLAVVVFRAARELLINVAKHANVQDAILTLARTSDMLVVEVADKGVGFPVGDDGWPLRPEPGRGGFGLFSIRERLEHMGGGMKIQSELNQGTTVRLQIPLAERASGQAAEHSKESTK